MQKSLLIIFCFVLCIGVTGCAIENEGERKEEYSVYSFYGENEQIKITNGVIILGGTEDVFNGGVLEEKNESLSDISMYSITFYITNGNDKVILLSNKREDTSGDVLEIEDEIGEISGDLLLDTQIEEMNEKLFAEVKVTNVAGEKYEYTIPLLLKKMEKTKSYLKNNI